MNYTKEQINTAKKEEGITPAQLLCEILPLLEEYMIGNFAVKGDNLSMSFLNGQKFSLQIQSL